MTRGIIKLRYEPENTLCLCAGCHFKAHQRPIAFAEWVKGYKGAVAYKRLIREANNLKPITIKFYQEILESLE